MSVFALATMAAAAAEDAAHGAAEASSGLPQLDMSTWPSQLFWLAVTFGILYWLMAGRFLPAIGGAIEERRGRIADDLDQASDFKRQADDAESAYNQELADAKAKAQRMATDTRAKVDADIAEMQAESDAKLQSKLDAAEAHIREKKTQAAAKVDEAAADATRAVVERLIDEAPTDDAVARAMTNIAR